MASSKAMIANMKRVDLRGVAVLVALANWAGEAWGYILASIGEALRLGAVRNLEEDRSLAKQLRDLGLKDAVAGLLAGTPLVEELAGQRVGELERPLGERPMRHADADPGAVLGERHIVAAIGLMSDCGHRDFLPSAFTRRASRRIGRVDADRTRPITVTSRSYPRCPFAVTSARVGLSCVR